MIQLEDFINKINESKSTTENELLLKDVKVIDPVTHKEVDPKDIKVRPGKNADDNGSRGTYAIDEADPKDFKRLTPDEEDELAENNYTIYDRIMDKKDFMVTGFAGWAKSSIIRKMAKMCGRSVITVYLDKAVASDLGGIPVPVEDADGNIEQKPAVPSWVIPLIQRPNDKFLLFFDELNQAQPDVLNALMPIILDHTICGKKFDNFIVGAAGNEMDENPMGLTDVRSQKALKARLLPLQWHTHDEETWRSAFDYLHEKFDDVIGKGIVDKAFELRNYWSSPRDVDRWILETFQEKLAIGRHVRPAKLKEVIMEGCIWDHLDKDVITSRSFEKTINDFVDFAVQYVAKHGNEEAAKEAEETRSRRSTKGRDQVNEDDKSQIITSLKQGFFFNSSNNDPENGDDRKYLCTVENCVTSLFDPDITGVTAEVLNKIVKEMKANGTPPKYKTNKDGEQDAKKHGWEILDENENTGFLVRKHLYNVGKPKTNRNTRDK